MGKEFVDLFDRKGQLVDNHHERWTTVPKGQYYKIVTILVENRDKQFLVTQRASDKRIYPSWYEATSGGAVDAGEDEETAARRELKEETGMKVGSLYLLKEERDEAYQSITSFYFGVTTMSPEAVTIAPREVSTYRWLNGEMLLQLVEGGHVLHLDRSTCLDYLQLSQRVLKD